MNFKLEEFNVEQYDEILAMGLSKGKGTRGNQVCIEAAICQVMGLPHNDDPKCVAYSVRRFKICLNDKEWSSPQARSKGLRDLGLAQLGSLGVIADKDFVKILSTKIIQVLIPKLFRQVFKDPKSLELALKCELYPTIENCRYAATYATYAAHAAVAADDAAAAAAAAYAADATAAAYSADVAAATAAAYSADVAAAYAADTASDAEPDEYLKLAAKLALETLIELKSPGCVLLKS